MLLADKLDLQNKLKLNMLQIEERELNYYTQNAMTVGTQAALLAGFAFTGVIEAPWDTFFELSESSPDQYKIHPVLTSFTICSTTKGGSMLCRIFTTRFL